MNIEYIMEEYMTIEYITDQILGYTQEVLACIEEIKCRGYSTEEAIKITELGVKDMEVETKHQLNKELNRMAHILDSLLIDR